MRIKKTMAKKLLALGLLPVALLVLSGCSDGIQAVTNSYGNDMEKLEETQAKLQRSQPVPEINNSQTRKSIAERAKLFDSENKTTYIYLVSFGKVMAFYPVRGQVVSLRSYLTPVENIVNSRGVNCRTAARSSNNEPSCGVDGGQVVSAPDIDGTYGDNVDGIFFFTADTGAYVEWKGDYMVSDQPLHLATQPELVREIKD